MPASPDLVQLTSIRHQVFQNNEWQYVDGEYVETTNPPAGNPQLVGAMPTFMIPNASAGEHFEVKGCVAPATGQWSVTLLVGKNPENSYGFPVIVQSDGTFAHDCLALRENDFTYIWVSGAAHTPLNPKGIDWQSCLRVISN